MCVLQSEHVDHVDSDSYIQVVTATHSLYLSLQVIDHKFFYLRYNTVIQYDNGTFNMH